MTFPKHCNHINHTRFATSSSTMDQDEAEAELRQRRFEAYFRGEILEKETEVGEVGEVGEKETAEAAEKDKKSVFAEGELQDWSCQRAVTWILGAKNFFELLGISPEQFPDMMSIRNRYRKLSLLVHPDKHKHSATDVTEMQATNSFQRLSDAMQVMFDDVARGQLFREIQLEAEEKIELQPRQSCWQPPETDQDSQSEDSDTLNGAVRDRVMQQSKLQHLLKRRRVAKAPKAPKSVKSPKAGRKAGSAGSCEQSCEQSCGQSVPKAADSTDSTVWQPATATPAATAASAITLEQLTELWQQGTEALAMAGWKRLESRRCPGHFYFAHVATGQTVMDIWERRQSRHDPSVFYFVNSRTAETSLETPPEKLCLCNLQISTHDHGRGEGLRLTLHSKEFGKKRASCVVTLC